jgi:hypothetical protein
VYYDAVINKKILQPVLVFCAALLVVVQTTKCQDSSEYNLSTNSDGSLTIDSFNGQDFTVNIPGTINGLPVTTIAGNAFGDDGNLYYVSVPSSITNIGMNAFGGGLLSLTEIAVDPGNPVYSTYYSGNFGALCDKNQTTFIQCPGDVYDSYTVPGGITSIAANAFGGCSSLPSVLIPASITNIGEYGFEGCPSLDSVYFQGNAPAADSTVFADDYPVTAYYLPGTTGWCDFSVNTGVPAVLWNPVIQTGDGYFGVQSNMFGFNITGTNDFTVVVAACTDLANPVCTPLQTLTLSNGLAYCCDSQWTNYPGRYYILQMP